MAEGTAQLAKLVGNDPHAPDITLPVVAFSLEYLGTHVEGSADAGESFECLGTELTTKAEVTHFQIAIVVYKNVRRFQVAMHDSLFVHVLKGRGNLEDVLDDALLWEVDFVLFSLLDDQFEVAFLGPLYRNEKLVQLAVDEPAEVLDDVFLI